MTVAEPRRVLLTAFDPFGGEVRNASADAASRLDGSLVGRARVEVVVLPTSFARAPALLREAVARLGPAFVLATGQSRPDDPIRVETTFRNVTDGRRVDNDGAIPCASILESSGPAWRGPSIDPSIALAALESAGIEAIRSDDAGAYVCNALAYTLAEGPCPFAFVHVPSYGDRDEIERAALAERTARALALVIAAIDRAFGR